MNNYQLYRTNVLLGGQMKYDLILNSDPNHTYISDIHISPISKDVPYSKHIEENTLNYSHSENIKNFYKKTENYFYNDFANPILNNIYPLPETYSGETSETTYEMGCRRMKYHLYNKQFEFLCPVWLEYIENIQDLKFNIDIYTGNDKNHLISRTIEFNQPKMIKYFNDYIKQLGLDKGCNWVFDINKDRSILTGLNVSTGQCENKDLLRLYRDLVSIERPLLEFNNIIINTLNNNHMITKQLFNFNLCFNFEDILNSFLIKELDNQSIWINVSISIKDEQLTCMDIFSNHTNIIKNFLEVPVLNATFNGTYVSYNTERGEQLQNTNVLDYLNDYNCVDLIDKNKIIQNTCHWSYSLDPQNSTFNMYDGFSLLYKNDSNELISIPYYNGKIPNLQVTDPSVANYPFWCNNYIVHSITGSDTGTNNLKECLPYLLNKEDHLFSKFSSNCVVKGINYKTKETYETISVIVLHYNTAISDPSYEVREILRQYSGWGYGYLEGGYKPNDANDVIFIVPYDYSQNDKKIIFICPTIVEPHCLNCNKTLYQYSKEKENGYSCPYPYVKDVHYNISKYENMFYRNIVKHLSKFSNDDKYKNVPQILKDFYEILKSSNPKYEQIIHFDKSLTGVYANSPSLSSKEIYYHKKKADKTIIRNLGKIKPYFIQDDDRYYNLKYSKKYLSEMDENYHQYSSTNYGPKYPSLNYFSLNSEREQYTGMYDSNRIEFHYYRNNRIFDLQPTMLFRCSMEDDDDTSKKIKQQIEDVYGEALHAIFDDDVVYENNLKYITNQYKLVHTNIEHENGKFIYEMQIKLK